MQKQIIFTESIVYHPGHVAYKFILVMVICIYGCTGNAKFNSDLYLTQRRGLFEQVASDYREPPDRPGFRSYHLEDYPECFDAWEKYDIPQRTWSPLYAKHKIETMNFVYEVCGVGWMTYRCKGILTANDGYVAYSAFFLGSEESPSLKVAQLLKAEAESIFHDLDSVYGVFGMKSVFGDRIVMEGGRGIVTASFHGKDNAFLLYDPGSLPSGKAHDMTIYIDSIFAELDWHIL